MNRRGYSIIELLTAMIVLGILSIATVWGVNKAISRAGEEYYRETSNRLVQSSQQYINNNRSKRPRDIGDYTYIYLDTLIKDNYISKVYDRHKKECIGKEVSNPCINKDDTNCTKTSYIKVFKYSKDKYSYIPVLYCPNYMGEEKYKKVNLVINISTNKGTSYFDDNNYFKFTIDGRNDKDNNKILSYSYSIVKGKNILYDSGVVENDLSNYFESRNIKISDYLPGEVKIVVKATNNYGVTSVSSTTFSNSAGSSNEGDLQCVKLETFNNWIIEDRKVSVGCSSVKSKCTKERYSKIFNNTSKSGYIRISDIDGHSKECKVDVLVDKSSPKIKTDSDNNWHNKDITLTISGSDIGSGLDRIEENDGSGWKVLPNSSSEEGNFTYTKTYSNEEDKVHTYRAYDKAGNYKEATAHIRIDKTKPVIDGFNNPYNNVWTNQNVNTVGRGHDPVVNGVSSGIVKWSWGIREDDKNFVTTGDVWNDTWSGERNNTIYVYAIDKAGNYSNYITTVIKIDKTAPVVDSVSIWSNASGYNSTSVGMSATSHDDFSGIYSTSVGGGGLGDTANSTSVSLSGVVQGGYSGQTITVGSYAKDNAGNVSYKSTTYVVYLYGSQTYQYGSWEDSPGAACSVACGGGTLQIRIQMHDRFLGGFVRYNYSTRACNTMDCCSSTHKTTRWLGCSAVCGGGYKYLMCKWTSNYDGRTCKEEICGGQACGTELCVGCPYGYLEIGCYLREIVKNGKKQYEKYHKCQHITNQSIIWATKC